MLRKIFRDLLPQSRKTSEPKNSPDIPAAWIAFFRGVFADADRVQPGASAKLLAYLTNGDHWEMLGWLGTHQHPDGRWWFNPCSDIARGKAISESVARGDVTDPGFWLRYAKLMETRSVWYRRTHPVAVDQASWLPAFIENLRGDLGKYPAFLSMDLILSMLEIDGHHPDAALPFVTGSGHVSMPSNFPGITAYLRSQRDALVEQISATKPADLPYFLSRLGRLTKDHESYADILCDIATSPAAKARREALALLRRSSTAPALMLKIFNEGDATQRLHAFEYLREPRRQPEGFGDLLRTRLEKERSLALRKAIETYLKNSEGARTAPGTAPAADPGRALSPLPPIPADGPPPESSRETVMAYLARFPEIGKERAKAIFRELGPEFSPSDQAKDPGKWIGHNQPSPLLPLIEDPDFSLVHLVRLFRLTGCLSLDLFGSLWAIHGTRDLLMSAGPARFGTDFTLRLIADHLQRVGLDSELVGWDELLSWNPIFRDLPSEAKWEYFAEHPMFFEVAFGLRQPTKDIHSYQWSEMRRRCYEILSAFPEIPKSLVEPLLGIALGSLKSEMSFARNVLEKVGDLDERLVQSVESKKQTERREAANWAADRGCQPALPALRRAVSKEKNDDARSAQLIALRRLGDSIEAWISPEAMAREAESFPGRSSEADSLAPFTERPRLTWKASGVPVPERILEWLLLRSLRANDPGSNPLLKLYLGQFESGPLPDFGLFILQTWIAQNGGEMKTKGLLALAGATCDSRAIPLVEAFLKKHYGIRAHQCKALLRMIAWIESPMAIQLLLGVANRFRTKGIQNEAAMIVTELAERNHWTLDELGDRTIPDAGFDSEGVLTLSYGGRDLTARLDDRLKITLHGDDGKTLSSLPSPRQGDDPDAAAESKRLLSLARKELKSVLTLQKERLYESLCTQRTWRFRDWDAYLNRHPIVSHYARSLVWIAEPADESVAPVSFRPLEDRSLTNLDDEEVILDDDAEVRLAHRCNVSEETARRWMAHFTDYEVSFLFEQFTKPFLKFEAKELSAKAYPDFEGHIVETFKLRSTATQLGYTRGPAEDGGWFHHYQKTFPTLGVTAVIQFTGNPLPEENREVALESLIFEKNRPTGTGLPMTRIGSSLRLSEVSEVLLSECVNDLRRIAATGPGLDPDWRKRFYE